MDVDRLAPNGVWRLLSGVGSFYVKNDLKVFNNSFSKIGWKLTNFLNESLIVNGPYLINH